MGTHRFLCAVVALGTIAGIGHAPHAAVATDRIAFIDDLASRMLKSLSQHLPPAEREQRLNAILLENFDMPRMTRFVLGR